MKKNKIRFACFHSEGAPYDQSDSRRGQYAIYRHHVVSAGFHLTSFTPRVLESIGAGSLVKAHGGSLGSIHNASIEKIGFAAWVPAVILLAMEGLNDGEVVFYNDVDIFKYPSYLKRIETAEKMLDDIFRHVDDIFFQREFPSQEYKAFQYCNLYQINEIGIDTEFTKQFPLLNTGMMVAKKTPLAKQFLLEWLTLCRIDRFIRPSPDGVANPDGFKHFTYVQSVGNMLVIRWIKEGLFPAGYPFISYNRGGYPGWVGNTDDSHVSYLEESRIQPLGGRLGSSIVEEFNEEFVDAERFYHTIAENYRNGSHFAEMYRINVTQPLESWRAITGGKISFQDGSVLILGDSKRRDWHLVQCYSEFFDDAIVELQFSAKSISTSESGIHIHGYGFGDVCNFDKQGEVIFKSGLLVDATCQECDEIGWKIYTVKFYNCHPSICIGIANPMGFHLGAGEYQYEIRNLMVHVTPMQGKFIV